MLQISALVVTFSKNSDSDNALRIFSIALSLLSFPLAVTTDYESERFASCTDYDLLLSAPCCSNTCMFPVQQFLLYISYLTMVIGRMMFILSLYLYFGRADATRQFRQSVSQQYGPVILVAVVLEVHHLIVLIGNLINRYITINNPKIKVVNKIKFTSAVMSYYIASLSEVFVILLQFPASYLRAVGPKARTRAPRKKSLVFFLPAESN